MLREKGAVILPRNKGLGADITFRAPRIGNNAKVEVKMVCDITTPNQYSLIKRDQQKQEKLRPCDDELFLIVFFLSLPNYDYRAGSLDGKSYPDRTFRNSGLHDQYRIVKKYLGTVPAWPVDQAFVQDLVLPSRNILAAIRGWCTCFSPPFVFDADIHLKKAVVGVAIWKICD